MASRPLTEAEAEEPEVRLVYTDDRELDQECLRRVAKILARLVEESE